MHVEISGAAEKIVRQLIASGLYETAEEAIHAIVLQNVQTRTGMKSTQTPGAEETPFAKAERLGLIGAARGLPPDLSSSERHMEGFGRA